MVALDSDLDIACCTEMQFLDGIYLTKLCTREAETHVVIDVIRRHVVALGGANVLHVVVPTATTDHAIRARLTTPAQSFNTD